MGHHYTIKPPLCTLHEPERSITSLDVLFAYIQPPAQIKTEAFGNVSEKGLFQRAILALRSHPWKAVNAEIRANAPEQA